MARPLAAGFVLLGATAVGALFVARAHARRDWPAMSPPLSIAPPAVRADRAAWPAFERAIAATPALRDRSALTNARPDAAGAQIVAGYAEAIRLFDAALASEATPILPERAMTDASPDPYFALIDLARARALSARIDAANARAAEALQAGVRIATFGARLAQQSSGWIGVAAGGQSARASAAVDLDPLGAALRGARRRRVRDAVHRAGGACHRGLSSDAPAAPCDVGRARAPAAAAAVARAARAHVER